MKTLLTFFVLLFSSSVSFNAYGGWFDKTVCVETDAQIRNDVIYLPNETEPFSGNNLCEYENGQIKSKGEIKDGKIDGKSTTWYENGQIASEANYKDGKINGELTSWHENGEIIKTVCHITDLIKTVDRFYLPNETEPFSGNNLCYYENGQLRFKGTIKDGLLVDKFSSWFENNQIAYQTEDMQNSLHSSTTKYWHPTGEIMSEFFIIDEKNSKSIGWHEDGAIMHEVHFKNNVKHGKSNWWFADGEIWAVQNYENGKCIPYEGEDEDLNYLEEFNGCDTITYF